MEIVEKWRVVEAFPHYRVSNLGRVQTCHVQGSNAFGEWRDKKVTVNKKTGYAVANFYEQGKAHTVTVHTLVLSAFVGQRPVGTIACHGNGNRADCRLDNLRWDTYAANEQDKHAHGTYFTRSRRLTDEQVLEMLCRLRRGEMTQAAIARLYGVSQQLVCDIKKGRTRSHLPR